MKRKMTAIAALGPIGHVAYAAAFFALLGIASLLEFQCNRSGLYMIFVVPALLLLVLYPLSTVAISAIGTALSAFALKRGESKVWNILIIVFLVLFTAVIFWRTVVFWQGAMGV